MSSVLANFVAEIIIGKGQNVGELSVYPVIEKEDSEPKYEVLDSSLKKKLIEITEVNDGGHVPELKVINHSSENVLMLDGEELIGAKQNRVLNTSILIGKEMEVIVPVSCVEEKRWAYKSNKFETSEFMMHANIRAKRSKSVNKSLKSTAKFQSDQHEVWDEIDETHKAFNIPSKTGAISDVYTSIKEKTEEILIQYKPEKGQKGFVIVNYGIVEGIEYVSQTNAFKCIYKKLLRSYIINYLRQKKTVENEGIDNQPKKSNGEVKEFLKNLADVKPVKYKSPGMGYDYRIDDKEFAGASLVHLDNVVHLAVQRL